MRAALSLAEARRIAVAAQRLDVAPPSRRRLPGRAAVLGTVGHLGVIQMDAVNVLARAHYVPLFSRLGPYATSALDDATYGRDRKLFEYWGHQASLLPVAMHPLFRFRMAAAERLAGTWSMIAKLVRDKRGFVDFILAQVAERGPVAASDLQLKQARSGPWWGWSEAKTALEWLFRAGLVASAARRNFERLYDLPERVLPQAILHAPTPSLEDSHRELIRVSAGALGVATDDDLADYFRLTRRDARPRIAELALEGALVEVRVEGIAKPMWMARGARLPREVSGRAILSPFDPLVWHRPRAQRLFDFRYRIEIYTPEHLRQHGYYVLPFLLGDRIAARVDLKADRAAGALLVQAAHLEPGAPARDVTPALAASLRELATWLALDAIVVVKKGALAPALARALR